MNINRASNICMNIGGASNMHEYLRSMKYMHEYMFKIREGQTILSSQEETKVFVWDMFSLNFSLGNQPV